MLDYRDNIWDSFDIGPITHLLLPIGARHPSTEPDIGPPPAPPEPPTSDNFDRALAFVLKQEGGWADHPSDPGGATMKGITLWTYRRWRAVHKQPKPTKDDLRNIPDAEVRQIYHDWYWQESRAGDLSWPLCLAVFDLAVNGGVGRSDQALSEVGMDFLKLMAWRIKWYTRLDLFDTFGVAWMRRCAALLEEAAK